MKKICKKLHPPPQYIELRSWFKGFIIEIVVYLAFRQKVAPLLNQVHSLMS